MDHDSRQWVFGFPSGQQDEETEDTRRSGLEIGVYLGRLRDINGHESYSYLAGIK
jgi:hypothetical protein